MLTKSTIIVQLIQSLIKRRNIPAENNAKSLSEKSDLISEDVTIRTTCNRDDDIPLKRAKSRRIDVHIKDTKFGGHCSHIAIVEPCDDVTSCQ